MLQLSKKYRFYGKKKYCKRLQEYLLKVELHNTKYRHILMKVLKLAGPVDIYLVEGDRYNTALMGRANTCNSILIFVDHILAAFKNFYEEAMLFVFIHELTHLLQNEELYKSYNGNEDLANNEMELEADRVARQVCVDMSILLKNTTSLDMIGFLHYYVTTYRDNNLSTSDIRFNYFKDYSYYVREKVIDELDVIDDEYNRIYIKYWDNEKTLLIHNKKNTLYIDNCKTFFAYIALYMSLHGELNITKVKKNVYQIPYSAEAYNIITTPMYNNNLYG